MDLLNVIRRWRGRNKLPIREITRRTGLSRNTIKKYLANGEVTPAYPARKSVSKLDPFVDTSLSWLKRDDIVYGAVALVMADEEPEVRMRLGLAPK